jgi:hypothetical protein
MDHFDNNNSGYKISLITDANKQLLANLKWIVKICNFIVEASLTIKDTTDVEFKKYIQQIKYINNRACLYQQQLQTHTNLFTVNLLKKINKFLLYQIKVFQKNITFFDLLFPNLTQSSEVSDQIFRLFKTYITHNESLVKKLNYLLQHTMEKLSRSENHNKKTLKDTKEKIKTLKEGLTTIMKILIKSNKDIRVFMKNINKAATDKPCYTSIFSFQGMPPKDHSRQQEHIQTINRHYKK